MAHAKGTGGSSSERGNVRFGVLEEQACSVRGRGYDGTSVQRQSAKPVKDPEGKKPAGGRRCIAVRFQSRLTHADGVVVILSIARPGQGRAGQPGSRQLRGHMRAVSKVGVGVRQRRSEGGGWHAPCVWLRQARQGGTSTQHTHGHLGTHISLPGCRCPSPSQSSPPPLWRIKDLDPCACLQPRGSP